MIKEDITPFVYYRGEVLKRAGLNVIKNIILSMPIFKFFNNVFGGSFKKIDEEIKKENPYMEQIINNIERKKKEKVNSKFEKTFPLVALKYKDKIQKEKELSLTELVGELVDRMEK